MYAFLAFIVFVALAVAARMVPYFRVDLAVTRAIQLFHGPMLDRLMYAVSWVDFAPQGEIIGAVSILALFFGGLRWEAVAASFAAFGIGVGLLVKQMVHRPRPAGDLILARTYGQVLPVGQAPLLRRSADGARGSRRKRFLGKNQIYLVYSEGMEP
jgi:hypothetical protein